MWLTYPPDPPPPPDVPIIQADVRVMVTDVRDITRVVVQKRTGPLLLAVTEGVYFGSTNGGSSSPPACWFVFWDEILHTTIPLSRP